MDAEEEVREEEMAEVNEEETVEVREEETVEVEEQSVTEHVEVTVVPRKRALSGAATYRCTFKNEWTTQWPFITVGTTSSYYYY